MGGLFLWFLQFLFKGASVRVNGHRWGLMGHDFKTR